MLKRDRFIVLGFALCIGLFAASATSVQAGQRFTAVFTGAQQVPPTGSAGTGYGYVILSDDQTTITVNAGYFGLGSNAVDGHIHTAPAGVNGPVTFPFSASPGGLSGVYPQQVFPISPAQVADLLAGNMYFNIHSTVFPGGEIRGQIGPASCATAGPVEVEATAANMGPTPYATLGAALTAISTGVHQGAINAEVCGDTVEAASATLTASGVTGAVYTAVNIYPVGAPRTITGSIVGAIIKLNGADNVTIDGRLGGAGSARLLTVSNTNTSVATAAIWLASVAAGNGASNNTIRNLEIACGADQQLSAASTFGIIQTGTTISTASTDGDDNDNNSFIANRIVKVRYGIVSRGVTTNNNLNPVITDNIIGPATFGSDQIGKVGIYMQADTGAVISRNLVQNVANLVANTAGGADRCGICIGSETWSATDATTITSGDYTVTRNIIQNIVEEKTFSSVGIKLATTRSGGATSNLVANNFILNVRANGTFGDQFCGIGIAGGNGDRVVFNSISITGDVDPAGASTSNTWGGGIRIPGANAANNANFTIQNNSIYLDVNSNTATQLYFAITLNSAAYTFGTGGLNRNNYYINAGNPQLRTGGLGTATTTGPGTSFTTLANWQAALTTPQDAQSIQADPLYFSNTTDLHIPGSSPNVDSSGIGIAGIVDDIDGQVRPNPSTSINDIGADEFYPSPGTLQFSAAAYSNLETSSATITVTRASGINGAVQIDYATVAGGSATGGASCAAGVDYVTTSGTLMWGDLDSAPKNFPVTLCADGILESNETVNLALSNVTVAGLGTPNAAVLTVNDGGTSFSGNVNVGTGEATTSLTNPGGVFQAINGGTVTGNVTINVTTDLTGETGAVALNEFASPFTVTIKPSGAARTVTGSTPLGMVPFNGTDRVVIDGSLSSGTDRSLTLTNTGSGGGINFATGPGSLGAQNNTVRNVNIWGGSSTATAIGIAFGGNTFGFNGANNDNNRVENCDLRQSAYGIYSVGESVANKNTGVVLTKNVMTATGASRIGRVGIFTGLDDGVQITENQIDGITSADAVDVVAIAAGSQVLGSTAPAPVGDQINAFIARNRIGVVAQTNTFSAAGIVVQSGTTGTNTVVNNMISGVIANSNLGDIVTGIYVIPAAGATQNIYHNSVSMTGDRGSATSNQFPSYALVITADQPVNVINNVLVNSQTHTGAAGGGGQSYAVGFDAATFTNLNSNHNDLFVSGPLGIVGITTDLTTPAQTTTPGTGVNRNTLADWQAATGDDGASLSIDPLFVSATDLHVADDPLTAVVGGGTAIGGITNDFDGDPRPSTGPDIGADELVQADGSVFPAGTFYNARIVAGNTIGGNINITNNLRLLGIVDVGANTLGIGCNATIAPADGNNFVIGNFRKDFCSTGTFTFPVGTANNGSARGNGKDAPEGTANEFSPATVTVNSIAVTPSSLTMSVVDTWMAGMGQTSSLSRFWMVTELGDLNVDMTMQYLPEDVYGIEGLYQVFRNNSIITTQQPGSVNTAANQFTATGVTSFSNWTAGNPNVPTAAGVDLSGRVTTADGRGIVNAIMRIEGGGLTQPRTALTGPFGYYEFTDLAAGQTYIVTIRSKRFTFAVPSRAVVLVDSIGDFDFVAEPQE